MLPKFLGKKTNDGWGFCDQSFGSLAKAILRCNDLILNFNIIKWQKNPANPKWGFIHSRTAPSFGSGLAVALTILFWGQNRMKRLLGPLGLPAIPGFTNSCLRLHVRHSQVALPGCSCYECPSAGLCIQIQTNLTRKVSSSILVTFKSWKSLVKIGQTMPFWLAKLKGSILYTICSFLTL